DTMMVGVVGKEAIAAVGLTGQPRMLMMSLFFALNVGVTAIVARRKGEGNPADANQTLRNALVLLLAISVVMMVVSLSISRPLILFAGAQPDTIDMANTYFRILMWALPINAATMCINAAQRGVGNTRITMYVNVVANLVNVLFNYLLIGGHLGFPRLEVAGAAIATVIGYCVGFVLALYSVISNRRQAGFLRLSHYDDWRLKRKTIESIARLGGNAMIEQVAMRIGFFAYAMIVAALGTDAFAAHNICMQFLNITFTFGDGIGVASTALVGQNLGQKRPDLSQMYGKMGQRMAMT
ncbi:MAG TPA: MATE family efflux transporter, partial [Clostridia bacterium]|nr:MATE family efflux transporter [Clostridia bacterium]